MVSPVRKVVVALAGASFALTMLGQVSSRPAAAAAPAPPTAITVSNVTSTGATLSWLGSSSAGVEGYRVLRGPLGTPSDTLRLIATADVVKTYTATHLFSSTGYEFGVASLDIAGNVSATTTVTVTTASSTDSTVPAAPSSTSVVATPFSDTRIDVQWAQSASSNVAAYEVWRDGARVATISLPAGLMYSDNGLAPVSPHAYTLRAISSSHVASSFTTGRSATTLATGTVKIARGPFLEQVTSTTAEVSWWTNIPTKSVVAYGTTSFGTTVSSTAQVYQHVIQLTGLAPGTTYQYKVSDGTLAATASATFRTAAPPGTRFSFDAIGDFGGGSTGEVQNATLMSGDTAEFVQTLGDNVYPAAGLPDPHFSTTLADFDTRFYQPFGPAIKQKSFNPADGNKEYYGDGEFWRNFDMPGRWYSYDWGDAHIVVLDSEQPVDPSSTQYNWAASDLAAHQQAVWRIVAMQRPPYSSTSANSSSKIAQTSLVPLFQAQNVNLVLSGNSHNYERSYPLRDGAPASGGVTYVVSGGGGNGFNRFTQAQPAWSAFREDNTYQYVRISVSPAQLTVNAVAASSGAVIDSVVIPVGNGGTGPTEPANLVAHASDPNTIRLSWKASSDSVSTITGYRVYRDATLINTVAPSQLSYVDSGLTPETTYTYSVSAVDAAGNESPKAVSSERTPSATSTVLTFSAATDATIDSTQPSSNFGAAPSLTVDGGPTTDFLVKFVVTGTSSCTVSNATLFLTVRSNSTATSTHGGSFFAAGNNWSESAVSWSNAPPASGAALATLGPVALNTTYQLDITSLVSGDGTYTLRASSASTDAAQYLSKEASTTTGPRLQVTCA